ncbi:uncharacterized protein LOC62_01G001663 [Vanrija pseudolonga]|uniref:Uncharacterized protein n=1 Tax=Vanrija pseudolonga TaxID=143232 RepID=A0AAF0Y140_9TREE|nr:hypothetical protein LOC62_01G001663 [Vanrija pseudolonga]
MAYRGTTFALILLLLVLLPHRTDAQSPFVANVNTTVVVHPPLGGGWDLGPADSSWRVIEGDSITAINSTTPAWFQYTALTNAIAINVSSETGNTNVSCLQSIFRPGTTLGTFGDVWYNTTLKSTAATIISVGNSQDIVFTSGFLAAFEALTEHERKTESQVTFYVVDAVYIPDNTTGLVGNPYILWSGDWEPAIVPEHDPGQLKLFGPTYRIARGNGSLWFPVPDNTSVMLVYGTSGFSGGNGIVTFTPTPPAASTGTSTYRAQWNMNDTNEVISNTPLDPKIQYNMTIEPATAGSNLVISRLWFGTGLL